MVGGLIASIVAGVFLIELPGGDLPGIALGSEAILVIERIAMIFTVWLLGVMVIARAVAGELPIEISGRGLRYADATTAHEGLLDSKAAFKRVDREIDELWKAVVRERRARVAKGQDDMLWEDDVDEQGHRGSDICAELGAERRRQGGRRGGR